MSLSVATWLKRAQDLFKGAGIGTARLDALVLLEDCIGMDRSHLLAHPELELSAAQVHILENRVARRVKHEPLAYIRGHTEFFGREFIITNAVLEPRPESETMIELLKSLPLLRRTMKIADIGTGSGALGITASLETGCKVDLIDIDPAALAIAKRNVIKFATDNFAILSDLLENTAQKYDILLCNLPYVPSKFYINSEALNEPKIAIFGGLDGLDVYRQLFSQLTHLPQKPRYILTEALPPQHTKLAHIASDAGYRSYKTEDFIQVFQYTS
ncbi:MAG TPA: HemK/PrmC family methyltransferase [Candidatus Saccharimonadales bacterium]|nr:HemK/PrmC family methyltransferase [Candidatus Saccharimonadales bacterium]